MIHRYCHTGILGLSRVSRITLKAVDFAISRVLRNDTNKSTSNIIHTFIFTYRYIEQN